ncbi:MAG: hypothetical protein Kow0063_42820 [Anaerolineae bacterium]
MGWERHRPIYPAYPGSAGAYPAYWERHRPIRPGLLEAPEPIRRIAMADMTLMKTFLQRAWYRSSQFFRAVGARVTDDDRLLVEGVLATPAQRALFYRMPVADQRHGVALLRALRAQGYEHPALMQAALLHDVAKSGAGITVFHRVAVVLLQAFRPAWLARLARDAERSWWRRPFARYIEHPAVGARWAEESGCQPMAVSLIRRHQSPVSPSSGATEDQLLRLLQAADEEN